MDFGIRTHHVKGAVCGIMEAERIDTECRQRAGIDGIAHDGICWEIETSCVILQKADGKRSSDRCIGDVVFIDGDAVLAGGQ